MGKKLIVVGSYSRKSESGYRKPNIKSHRKLSKDKITKGEYFEDVKEIKLWGEKLKLKKPLRLKIEYSSKDDIYTVSNEELGLHAISDDLDNALYILSLKIETLYDVYVSDKSMELTKDAVRLREKIKEYL